MHVYKVIIRLYIEYYSCVWSGGSTFYLEILDRIEKRVAISLVPIRHLGINHVQWHNVGYLWFKKNIYFLVLIVSSTLIVSPRAHLPFENHIPLLEILPTTIFEKLNTVNRHPCILITDLILLNKVWSVYFPFSKRLLIGIFVCLE